MSRLKKRYSSHIGEVEVNEGREQRGECEVRERRPHALGLAVLNPYPCPTTGHGSAARNTADTSKPSMSKCGSVATASRSGVVFVVDIETDRAETRSCAEEGMSAAEGPSASGWSGAGPAIMRECAADVDDDPDVS